MTSSQVQLQILRLVYRLAKTQLALLQVMRGKQIDRITETLSKIIDETVTLGEGCSRCEAEKQAKKKQ